MAYIYKKSIKGKDYYYLRVSQRKGDKILAKDVAYLGSTLEEVKERIGHLPAVQIRNSHKTLMRFLESNVFLNQAHEMKLKQSPFMNGALLEQIEACRLHWQRDFQKRNALTKQEALQNFAIEFTFNTTSLEGNTITLKEAARLLSENITPKNKTLREVHDVTNTERVFLSLFSKPSHFTHESIIELHKNLLLNIDNRSGYRTAGVRVLHARFKSSPAPYVRTDMGLLLGLHSKSKFHPFVLSCIFHHQFEKIHPFFDGNGRVGRMLMNAILLDAGYPPLIIQKRNRAGYLDVLAKADAAGLGETKPGIYRPLVEFVASEYAETYWNNFL